MSADVPLQRKRGAIAIDWIGFALPCERMRSRRSGKDALRLIPARMVAACAAFANLAALQIAAASTRALELAH